MIGRQRRMVYKRGLLNATLLKKVRNWSSLRENSYKKIIHVFWMICENIYNKNNKYFKYVEKCAIPFTFHVV